MKENLTEDEMRAALFGSTNLKNGPSKAPEQSLVLEQQHVSKSRKAQVALSPRLRVTLKVTKDYDGVTELFIYDANTLSTLIAEQDAKAEAKKKKFKYFELVSIKSI